MRELYMFLLLKIRIFGILIYKNNQVVERQSFYKSVDGNSYLSINFEDENGFANTLYKYEEGKLSLYSNDNSAGYSYLAEKQEYNFFDGNVKKIYDKNLNLKQVVDYTKQNQAIRTNYWSGNPIDHEIRIYENENLKEQGLNPFLDKDLIPAEYYEIGNTNNIQGEKNICKKITHPTKGVRLILSSHRNLCHYNN